MAAVPIYNPPVPYLGYIDGGFGPGRMLRIQGGASSIAQRFAINLQCGPNTNPRDDIALHLSPRFMENFIMRSCLQNQSWTGEETHGMMPLSRGQNFEIIILCDPAHYKIAVNGQHFGEYIHRIPFSRVTHLTIDGDVTLSLVSFEGGYAPPPVAGNSVPGYAPVPPMPSPGMMPGGVPGAAPYPAQPGMTHPYQGPMPGYGAPPMYGGGGYAPQGPQPYGGYGGYGPGHPPPPPGYQQGKSSGGGILDKAGLALAGALGGAGIMGAVGGKYPSLPQGHGDSGQGSMGGGGSIGGLGSLGTLIGTGLAGAALSGVMGGKDNPAGNNPDNKAKDPTHKDTPTTNSGGGTSSSGGLGYLGNLISPGLAGAIQAGIMGGPDHNTASNTKYPNPYAPSNPAAGSAGGLGSLGGLIGSGLAGMMSGQGGSQPNPYNPDRNTGPNARYPNPYAPSDPASGSAGGLGSLGSIIGSGLAGMMSGQGGSQPNAYDRRAPSPYGGQGQYGGHGQYGGQAPYGGGQGGGGGLESLGGLIGSGLAGAISSRLLSGGGGSGKEQSNRAAHLYSAKGDEKSNHKSGGKIDEDLIRSLDELIVGPEDKPLSKNVIKFADAAPIKSMNKSELESGNEPEKSDEEPEMKSDKKPDDESVKKSPNKVIEDIDDIFAMYAEKPMVKSTSDTNRKTGVDKADRQVEEPIIKVDASDKP